MTLAPTLNNSDILYLLLNQTAKSDEGLEIFLELIGAKAYVHLLLESGAHPDKVNDCSKRAISMTNQLDIVRMLVALGQDLGEINDQMRIQLIGIGGEDLQATPAQYHQGKSRKFGQTNPEMMEIDFWRAMVCSGCTTNGAREIFHNLIHPDNISLEPVWFYQRFGRTITELPDGRIIEIAGEHEDYYDPDFCIYNDVVLYEKDRSFKIFGYPRSVFPPTDFHTAT
ncbi:MAG: hypothetical protein HC825_04600 [Oscillatoriales cyanobacterium RM1_1_9]|nr:hypothetical protein [Oscillatoriales cyanobacterium SM2_3_0]NJO47673.1 hypothetical protein [Oscillatoriales cyanobacterium RM2_1_1]NJO71168.1 hypothetical protein [Oscillatoriales cyanobacterium RM1_1_9]